MRRDRNCSFGAYDAGKDAFYEEGGRKQYENYDNLIRAVERNPDYTRCDSATCKVRRGTVWLTKEPSASRCTAGWRSRRPVFDRYKRRFKLATFASGTLAPRTWRRILPSGSIKTTLSST